MIQCHKIDLSIIFVFLTITFLSNNNNNNNKFAYIKFIVKRMWRVVLTFRRLMSTIVDVPHR